MTGRDIVALLKYEATRRPEIAELVSKVSHLTDADIDASVVPLPWFRTALRVMRDRVGDAAMIGAVLANSEAGFTPDPIGSAWRYIGADRFMAIEVPRSNMCGGTVSTTMEMEIKYGQLVWCSADHFWLDSSIAAGRPPEWFFQSSESIGEMTRTKYGEAYRARIMQMPEFYDPRDQRTGFRIIRH